MSSNFAKYLIESSNELCSCRVLLLISSSTQNLCFHVNKIFDRVFNKSIIQLSCICGSSDQFEVFGLMWTKYLIESSNELFSPHPFVGHLMNSISLAWCERNICWNPQMNYSIVVYLWIVWSIRSLWLDVNEIFDSIFKRIILLSSVSASSYELNMFALMWTKYLIESIYELLNCCVFVDNLINWKCLLW